MRTQNGGGDSLARGASRFQFKPAEKKMTDEEYKAMFEDFDPEKFAAEPNKSMQRSEPEVEPTEE